MCKEYAINMLPASLKAFVVYFSSFKLLDFQISNVLFKTIALFNSSFAFFQISFLLFHVHSNCIIMNIA